MVKHSQLTKAQFGRAHCYTTNINILDNNPGIHGSNHMRLLVSNLTCSRVHVDSRVTLLGFMLDVWMELRGR